MKKFLSIVLTLMMVFSVFTTVSAATEPTLSELINQYLRFPANSPDPILSFTGEDRLNNDKGAMKVTIEGRRTDGTSGAYQETGLELSASSLASGVYVDFQTTLNMEPLKDVIKASKFLTDKLLPGTSAESEFNAGVIETDIWVTIDYPGATVDTEKGSLRNDNGIFQVESRVKDPNTNKLTIKFNNNKDGTLTVGTLMSNPDKYLDDLTFVLAGDDAAKYTAEGTLTVGMKARTKVTFNKNTVNEKYYYIDYKGKDTYKVTAYTPSTGGTSRYTLTYETNGGSPIDKETYARNAIAKLTKVPKKEGYIFEGWYLDKELTQRVTEVKMTKNITVYAAWVEDNGIAGGGYDTPEKLNGDDHFAYIVGYPEGDVRPGNNITRAEVTTIFFRLLKENERNMNLVHENNFSDVDILDWYNTAVSTMAKLGIVNGRNAETFDPNAFITRAEFAAICARFADTEVEAENKFTDVAGHWAEKEIYEAAEYGWIRGYEDNTFRPDRFITRAEAMTMINRVLNRIPENVNDLLDDMKKWSDNSDEAAWYYIPVQEATNSHDYDKKNNVYEKWTSLNENFDWTKYEK